MFPSSSSTYLLLTVESPLIDHILYSGAEVMAILAKFCNHANVRIYSRTWGYGKEKIRGGGKKFSRLFRIVPALSKKLLSTGGGGRSDYEQFLLDSIFPTKLTEFPTKLTEFFPFIFIISQYCPTVKRILPDWLCLPPPLPPPPPPGTPMLPYNDTFIHA